jgi:hypothetical protein
MATWTWMGPVLVQRETVPISLPWVDVPPALAQVAGLQEATGARLATSPSIRI